MIIISETAFYLYLFCNERKEEEDAGGNKSFKMNENTKNSKWEGPNSNYELVFPPGDSHVIDDPERDQLHVNDSERSFTPKCYNSLIILWCYAIMTLLWRIYVCARDTDHNAQVSMWYYIYIYIVIDCPIFKNVAFLFFFSFIAFLNLWTMITIYGRLFVIRRIWLLCRYKYVA